MKNFNNFNWDRKIINDIDKIMESIGSVDCEIKCENFTITNLKYEVYDEYEYTILVKLSSNRKVYNIIQLENSAIEKIHEFLIKKYDYILSGKDIGLL